MIHVSLKGNIQKILVDSDINNEKELNCLLDALSSKHDEILYEITFVELDYLPFSVIKLLYKLDDKISITATHKSLWVYLSKLGIKSRLQSHFEQTSQKNDLIKAIAIGGSAGSIEGILKIVKHLPYSDLSIFIIVHILPDKKSQLAEIIQKETAYQVFESKHNMRIEKNSIYVVAPNKHLTVVDGYIYLDEGEAVSFARPSIDISFKSLAYEYQNSLLAILLCGYGSDGSESLLDLRENNSKLLIQDPSECEAKEMLYSAIETNNYTKILSLEKIQKYIKYTVSVEVDIEDEIENFLENIKVTYDYDFRQYDRSSLQRRIKLVMDQSTINTFKEFKKLVLEDEVMFAKLLSAFSINVTTFFRNPEIYLQIKEEIIPYIESFPSVRIWSAGCSRGDEAYSLAITLDELGILDKSIIYATDFNPRVINEAKNALFGISEFDDFKTNYIQSGGKKEFEDYFDFEKDYIQIKEYIRKKVLFFQHNLVTDGSINEFQFICCRNVLIYFDKLLQKNVFENIDESLLKGGYLILGESELLPEKYKYSKIGHIKNKMYKKDLL